MHLATTTQQMPDLPGAADAAAEVAVPEHPLDLHDQLGIRDRSRGRRALLERVVTGRSDLHPVLCEHAADRLDPEPVTMIIDELNYHGSRGSSSRAKKLDAASRISFARFNSRTSASSRLIRCASFLVVPGRSPASIAACLHQPRSVSEFTPTRCPIRTTAAFSDSSDLPSGPRQQASSHAHEAPADTSSVLA